MMWPPPDGILRQSKPSDRDAETNRLANDLARVRDHAPAHLGVKAQAP